MGYHFMQDGEYSAARNWYTKLLNLDASNKEWQIKALQSMALINYKEKDYISARENYNKILILNPNDRESKKAVEDLTKVINAARNLQ
jgi:tetratricopeptide (TPR) repeat protein